MFINQADTFFTGFRSDEHDDSHILFLGYGTIFLHIIFERQVGDNHPVDSRLPASAAEILESILHDGIEISHQHQRNLYFFTDIFQLVEKKFQCHAVFQGAGGGVLDNGTVSHRVTERNADFNHVNPFFFQDFDGACRTF